MMLIRKVSLFLSIRVLPVIISTYEHMNPNTENVTNEDPVPPSTVYNSLG